MSLTLPTTKQEAWRYTNVSALAALRFVEDPAGALSDVQKLLHREGPRLVFVNGHFVSALSILDDRLQVGGAHAERGTLIPAAHPFVQMNVDGKQDTASVVVAQTLKTPLEIVHVTDARQGVALALPRTLIIVEAGVQASIIERYVALGATSLTSAVTEIVLRPGAVLDHVKWLDAKSYHVGVMAATVSRDATLRTFLFSLSGKIARSECHVTLAQGASVHLDGVMLARGEELSDLETVIDHQQPHGTSRQVVRGVLADKGQSVFDGRIVVAHGAVKTDSGQQNKTLLLSQEASAVSKPHLEIHADDVKCAHGSTSGQLSADALFYLRARGIPEAQAQAILAYGFAREVIERIGDGELRMSAESALQGWLEEVAR